MIEQLTRLPGGSGWIPALLHVYSPRDHHDDAMLVGNKAGLIALRDAVDAAIKGDNGRGHADLFTADGEGFELRIAMEDGDWQKSPWRDMALPYTVDWYQESISSNAGKVNYPGELFAGCVGSE
jgi:hypothetical protein